MGTANGYRKYKTLHNIESSLGAQLHPHALLLTGETIIAHRQQEKS